MARPLTVLSGQNVPAVTDALTDALAGSSALCVFPDTPPPPGLDWAAALHLDQPVPAGIAALVATSGSTGAPRAVQLSAGALLASAHATLRRLHGPGVWLLALPVSSIGGLQVLVRSRLAGLDPVCLDPGAGFRAETFFLAAQALPRGLPRYASLVPTQLRRLIAAGPEARDALAAFDSVLVGGAALDPELRSTALAAGVAVVSTYGMTETSGGCVYDGIPLEGVHVQATPQGLRIGGPVVACGYHGRPDETRNSFVDDWFLTRDAGHVDVTGRVSVTGRIDDVINSGGVNVAPGPVEEILRQRADIAEAVVVGWPDEEWGQAVVALVVPVDSAPLPLNEVRAYVAVRLGAAAAPRQILSVHALPRLHSGKLDREAAARLVAGRPPETAR